DACVSIPVAWLMSLTVAAEMAAFVWSTTEPFTSPDDVWPKIVRLSVISAANSSAALALNETLSGNPSGNPSANNMDTSLLDVVKSIVGQEKMKAHGPDRSPVGRS